ncbi:hypothetical protein APR12_003633 [Nocardia amikacinitolerans]|nr:hypothetical protein [Nocardia amikacinitolerans]
MLEIQNQSNDIAMTRAIVAVRASMSETGRALPHRSAEGLETSCRTTTYTSKYSSNSYGCGRRFTGAISWVRLMSIQVSIRSGVKTLPSVR